MYPTLLDMTESESNRTLRILELDAYAGFLAVLRAQGPPSIDKLKLLRDVGNALHISNERHKAEVRKVALDERLNTIAFFQTGQTETSDDWVKEGRRIAPLLSRAPPQTVYTPVADDAADAAVLNNNTLPLPANTDRKRVAPMPHIGPEGNKTPLHFKVPESIKCEEGKKRKLSFALENSTLAQHLMGPSKASRISEFYRQKPKVKPKIRHHQPHLKSTRKEPDHHREEYPVIQAQEYVPHHQEYRLHQQKIIHTPQTHHQSPAPSSKINILQNISVNSYKTEETIDNIKSEVLSMCLDSPQPSFSSDVAVSKPQKPAILSHSKSSLKLELGNDLLRPTKVPQMAPKVVSKAGSVSSQKLIIVSNAQSIATSSILQRTLTIPFVKNLSVKNLEKFKIVSTTTGSSSLQSPVMYGPSAPLTVTSNSAKHKVMTVRTNTMGKKVIPLSHLQALNAKGSIKMVPIGGKLLAKGSTAVASAPIYITMAELQAANTRSTTSTPIMVTARQQEPSMAAAQPSEESKVASEILVEPNIVSNEMLIDILKASGVVEEDIETQITQLTAIPQTVPDKIMADETQAASQDPQQKDLEVNKESIEKEANESNFRVISEDFVNKSTVCLETISAEDNSIEEEISVDAVTDDIGAIN